MTRNFFEAPIIKAARQRRAEAEAASLPPRTPLHKAGTPEDELVEIAKRSRSPIVKAALARREELLAERAADPHRDW